MSTLIATVLFWFFQLAAAQSCYWPNADVALDGNGQDYIPCAGLNGPCCAGQDDFCLPDFPGKRNDGYKGVFDGIGVAGCLRS